MGRYLVVDQGNTCLKIAIFEGDRIEYCQNFAAPTEQKVIDFVTSARRVDAAIVSTSSEFSFDIVEELERCGIERVEQFSHSTPLPIKNLYATPQTLGLDRLLSATEAHNKFGGKEVLIIDLGTAITIDRLSAEGEFLGGAISLGLKMRFKALSTFTKNLPQLRGGEIDMLRANYCEGKIPTTTLEAIFYGVVEGIIHEIRGYLRENQKKVIYFTGGDALFFEKLIKIPIFVNSQSTLCGLRTIIERLCIEKL
ncbi:MAG: type III pantothenate kinase [Rikenellaceae bacterium]